MTKKYSVIQDHKKIKAQIKEWEKVIDYLIITEHRLKPESQLLLEDISNEMMAINI